MSQRTLFVILSAVLFAACEDDTADTIVSLNAVKFTKSHLRDSSESARYTAYQTDILAARLAGFTDSAAVFADSVIAFADSARVASVLLAAADHDFRVVEGTANSFFWDHADEAKVIEKAKYAHRANSWNYKAGKAYEVARRKAFAAYVAAGAAYDARNARLASSTYDVTFEEAELSEDGAYWHITLGYPVNKRTSGFVESLIYERKYTIFVIDGEAGTLRSLKMRPDVEPTLL